MARLHRFSIITATMAGLSLLFVPIAGATPVAFEFTGTTTFQNGDFAGQGSSVTGTIQFDDGLTDGNPNADVAQYNKLLAANASLAGSFAYSITVGATTKTGNGAIGTAAYLQLFDDATQVSDSVTFQVGTAPTDYLLLRALSGSGADVDLPDAPSGFNAIADVIALLANLEPSQFGSSPSLWGSGANQVQFTWDSVALVPEPSTALLLGLGLLGLGTSRRR